MKHQHNQRIWAIALWCIICCALGTSVPAMAEQYTLTVVKNPSNADAYTSYSTPKLVEEGANVSIYAYENKNFKFLNWTLDGEVVSTNSYYNITMPNHDVTYVANFEFDPNSPNDPNQITPKHWIFTSVDPERAGSMSTDQALIREGDYTYITFYPRDNYKLKYWLVDGVEQDVKENTIRIDMGSHNIELKAVAEFNPTNPSIPGANSWDPKTGTMVLGEIEYDNIYTTIRNFTNNFAEIKSLIIMTELTSRILTSIQYGTFSNTFFVDFSHSWGFEEIPGSAFRYSNMETLLLPSCVKSFGDYVFNESNLLSNLTLYSKVPPTITDNTFAGFENKDNLTVYVPIESMQLYEADPAWNQFELMPIVSDVSAITINLPEGSQPGQYNGYRIELVNMNSGNRVPCVVTDRLTYCFPTVLMNEPYSIYLYSPSGLIVSRIENIVPVLPEHSYTFSNVKSLHNVIAYLVSSTDGLKINANDVEWYEPQRNGQLKFLYRGAQLQNVPDGQTLVIRPKIGEYSSFNYFMQADDVEFTATGDDKDLIVEISMTPLPKVEIKGKMTDELGVGTKGIVSISSRANGTYQQSSSVNPSVGGSWSISQYYAPEYYIQYSATDCYQVLDTLRLAEPQSVVDLGRVTMKSASGPTITYSFTLSEAAVADAIPSVNQNYNPSDVQFSAYNATKDCVIPDLGDTSFSLSLLNTECSAGDKIRITAHSLTGEFSDVTNEVTLDAQMTAKTTFAIKENGRISMLLSKKVNPQETALLYDNKGNFIKQLFYGSNEQKTYCTFTNLAEGTYKVVSIGHTPLLNGMQSLAAYDRIGLEAGTDYIVSEAVVEQGVINQIFINAVPQLDDKRFNYTSERTLNFGKSTITLGNNVTLYAKIDLKANYKTTAKNVKLLFDLPENCELLSGSAMRDFKVCDYELAGNQLQIDLPNLPDDQVRFVVTPSVEGDLHISAFVQFEYEGNTIVQPLGDAVCAVKGIAFVSPQNTPSENFRVSGRGPAKSKVEIYDGTTKIGETTIPSNTFWVANCQLPNPKIGSKHTLQAAITLNSGIAIKTQSNQMVYNPNFVEVESVTQINVDYYHRENTVVFDFINPGTTNKHYDYYSNYPEFTYKIKLNTSDPEKVTALKLYVYTKDDETHIFIPEFDESQGVWVANASFQATELPTNVDVTFEAKIDPVVDESMYEELKEMGQAAIADLQDMLMRGQALIDQMEALDHNSVDSFDEYMSLLAQFTELLELDLEEVAVDPQNIFTDFEEMAANTATTASPELIASLFEDQQEYVENMQIGDYTYTFKKYSELGQTFDFEAEGWTQLFDTSGDDIWQLTEGNTTRIVIIAQDLYYELVNNDPEIAALRAMIARAAEKNDAPAALSEAKQKIAEITAAFIDKFERLNGKILTLTEEIRKIEHNIKWQAYVDNPVYMEYAKKKLGDDKALMPFLYKNVDTSTSHVLFCKSALKFYKVVKTVLPIYNCIMYFKDASEQIDKVISMWYSIPNPCPDDESDANWCRGEAIAAGVAIGVNVARKGADMVGQFGSLMTVPESAGTSLLVTAGLVAWDVACDFAYEAVRDWGLAKIMSKAANLKCYQPCKCKKGGECKCSGKCRCHKNPKDDDANGAIDPSGYVYEAVPSNRLANVEASIYFQDWSEDIYGDPVMEETLWDAEEYAQKNPLFTDENGMYQWDVPVGMWQVRLHKDGYSDTRSEWLPVPPPQLDINLPMVQHSQPYVKKANAYEEGVMLQFDKYMDITTVTPETVLLSVAGEQVSGTIKTIDDEIADPYAKAYDTNSVRYASIFRFVPDTPLSISQGQAQLTVTTAVKSYAGVAMASIFQQDFDIEPEIKEITTDNPVQVKAGTDKIITVSVAPFEAAVGKTLNIASSTPSMITVLDKTAVIDENGQAKVAIHGELPGNGALQFTIDDSWIDGLSTILVVNELYEIAKPTASRPSGSEVYEGTLITLSTDVPNADIYYTLDGSCPSCDENSDSRYRYTGPISVTEPLTIKAYVLSAHGEESETADFTYTLKHNNIDLQFAAGWNWISHNLATDINTKVFASEASISRILGKNAEASRDSNNGLAGTLSALSPEQSYKVLATAPANMPRLTDLGRNPETPIYLSTGWNWVGYSPTTVMSVGEALAATNATDEDYIVGQKGFAQYNGSEWEGTLDALEPGLGYIYCSKESKLLTYTVAAPSKAAARMMSRRYATSAPWAIDINKYPQVMPMVATLIYGDDDIDASSYTIGAFCGSECRGVGKVVNGKVMMSIYGNTGDKISIVAIEQGTTEELELDDYSFIFADTMIGSVNDPFVIRVGGESSLRDLEANRAYAVSTVGKQLYVTGNLDAIRNLSVINVDGRAMLHATHVAAEGISLEHLTAGVYAIVIESGSTYSYFKVTIK